MDSYTPPREPTTYGGSPVGYAPEQSPSPYARQQPPPRTLPHRNSIAIPYNTTPSRPTPLSQEVPRARSPQPGYNPPQRSPQPFGHSPYQHEQPIYDSMPPNQRRSVSPLPAPRSAPNTDPRPKSSYALQHPVHAFESSDGSPLSTSQQDPRQARSQGRGVPVRKSVSPNPSPGGSAPFSPDDFGVHNPYARPPPTANSASPHSPYQIRPGSEAYARDDTKGPIVGWHGQEIDPSDHLPVDSWAPEPEKKTPAKTYGLGRNRDFGPRTAESSGERNLSRDTKINVRMKPAPSPPANPYSQPPPPETSPTKGKLQKKPGRSPGIEPLREHHNYNSVSVPDPYAQTQDYSRGFYGGRAEGGYGAAALEREISSIDLGHSSRGHVRQGSAPPAQAPVSYVPVRSQRDRYTYY